MSKSKLPESQAFKAKDKYRVTNWPEYDRALVRRGDITVWFEEDFLRQHWRGQNTGKRGAPLIYSDAAIQVLLMLKAVFGLSYRSVEALACSLMRLMGLELPVPDTENRPTLQLSGAKNLRTTLFRFQDFQRKRWPHFSYPELRLINDFKADRGDQCLKR
jgi:hypothetical protein